MTKTRQGILDEARRMREEIQQLLTDCAAWNELTRASGGDAPLDPDPDGTLRCLLAYVDGILNGDVYLAPERS